MRCVIVAKFTFTKDYDEKQPGGKRRWKAWKAGQTYTMTRQHAEQLEAEGYGYTDAD